MNKLRFGLALYKQVYKDFPSPEQKIAINSLTTNTLATLAEKLLYIIDGRASYYIYATNNGNSTIWFLFRVAPVSKYQLYDVVTRPQSEAS